MKKFAALIGGLAAAGSSFAATYDYTTLTASADYTAAGAAVLVVCAALGGVYVMMTGANMVLDKLKGRK